MNDALSIEELGVRRAGRTILDRVSLILAPGEILAVIGANGAGKTTLLEATVGAIRADSGFVRHGGARLATLRARAMVFSYLSDAAEPPAEARVDALLRHAQVLGGLPRAEANELADRLGLSPLLSVRVGELSRGEKRRVSLLCALCTRKPVIVLDEPLGTFDPLQLPDVLDVLRERARHGASLLLSVHQLSDAEKVATRVAILDRGCVVAAGSLDELRTSLGSATASLETLFLRALERRRAQA